jgi:hypothetical protein
MDATISEFHSSPILQFIILTDKGGSFLLRRRVLDVRSMGIPKLQQLTTLRRPSLQDEAWDDFLTSRTSSLDAPEQNRVSAGSRKSRPDDLSGDRWSCRARVIQISNGK